MYLHLPRIQRFPSKHEFIRESPFWGFFTLSIFTVFVFLLIGIASPPLSYSEPSVVVVATYEGVINPVSNEYLHEAIEFAETEKAQCLVFQLDTPGGLDTSMRAMIKDMIQRQRELAGNLSVGAFLQKVCKHHLLVSVSGCVFPSLVDVAFQCGGKRLLIVGLGKPVARPKAERGEVGSLDSGATEGGESYHPCRLHALAVDKANRLGGEDVTTACVSSLVDLGDDEPTRTCWEGGVVKSWGLCFELWDRQLLSDFVWASLDGHSLASVGSKPKSTQG